MIWRSGSIRWLPPSRTVLACAGILLSISAVCQSDPAALDATLPPYESASATGGTLCKRAPLAANENKETLELARWAQ